MFTALFQPFAFGAGVRAPVILGCVLSILTTGEVTVAVFPALSVAVTVFVSAFPQSRKRAGSGETEYPRRKGCRTP